MDQLGGEGYPVPTSFFLFSSSLPLFYTVPLLLLRISSMAYTLRFSLSLSLSLSFSLTSVFWHALCVPTCRIGCNSTCPFGRKKRPGRSSLPGRNRYPSNFFLFFSFAWVIDRGPVPAVFACFFLCLIVRSLSRRQARVKDARVSR